ncbi:MAG TPA: acyltransferase [Chitinophagaceae bacterium]|jgi:peptidoglycan/LPS O-acetylase OafA/YrhL|nr:acyltransferase [Chitinophagaceae bacterium]
MILHKPDNQIGKNTPSHLFYAGLDSFRGIGILWIICCHYFPHIDFFRFGWVSLEFFFVLSGFLITKVLLHSSTKKNFFSFFYMRRALRIFPIYFLFIIIFFAAVFLISKPHHFVFLKENFFYYFIYLQNFLFVFKGLEPEKYLNHLWSLAMEEQFYFLWPLAIYYIRDLKRLKKILWFIICFAFVFRVIVWYFWGERFEVYHCNTFARIDTIAFGCLLGCGFSYKDISKKLRVLLISVCISIFIFGFLYFKDPFITNPVFCTLGYSAFSFLSILFLEYFISEEKKFRFLKTNRLVNYLGQISYGMYLIHIPILLFLLPRTGLPETMTSLLCILLTFILASLSYWFYEIKFLNMKKKFPVQ